MRVCSLQTVDSTSSPWHENRWTIPAACGTRASKSRRSPNQKSTLINRPLLLYLFSRESQKNSHHMRLFPCGIICHSAWLLPPGSILTMPPFHWPFQFPFSSPVGLEDAADKLTSSFVIDFFIQVLPWRYWGWICRCGFQLPHYKYVRWTDCSIKIPPHTHTHHNPIDNADIFRYPPFRSHFVCCSVVNNNQHFDSCTEWVDSNSTEFNWVFFGTRSMGWLGWSWWTESVLFQCSW